MKISTLLLHIIYKNGGSISIVDINNWLNQLLELEYLEIDGFNLKLTEKALKNFHK